MNLPCHMTENRATTEATPTREQALEALHDIGNELQRISLYCAHLRESNASNDRENHLEAIMQSSQHCTDLIRSMTRTSNQPIPAPIDPTHCEVNAVAVAVIENHHYLSYGGISIELIAAQQKSMQNCLPKISLYRCLANLLINARQAVAAGGKILVKIGSAVTVTDHVCASCGQHFGGNFICLSMSDNGHGISAAQLPQIFQPFNTNKPNSAGIGLSSVHNLMHQSGGHTDVESVVGGGSTFTLYLPIDTRS